MNEILTKYPFLQNIHFCKMSGVPYWTIKKFMAGKQKLSEQQEKLYIRNYSFLLKTVLKDLNYEREN